MAPLIVEVAGTRRSGAALRILSVERRLLHEIPFLVPAIGGGLETRKLTVLSAVVDRLPGELTGMIATSDLQGFEITRGGEPGRLIGEVLAEELEVLAELGEIPPAQTLGVLLAGDMYAKRTARGGEGDAWPVWAAFAGRFKWVIGVAGNHDRFGADLRVNLPATHRVPNVALLDESCAERDGLRVAGVSGIVGDPRKRVLRRSQAGFLAAVDRIMRNSPHVLLLHQPPAMAEPGFPGDAALTERLSGRQDLLVICGHLDWKGPLATIPRGPQVLNVNSAAFVLTECPNYNHSPVERS